MLGTGPLVWPLWQRLVHWLLAISVVVALLTRHGGTVHEISGYAALALAFLRCLIGLVGPIHARFSTFLKCPKVTLEYARQFLRGKESRHINHNPLGAAMLVTLLAFSLGSAASGWLYITDRFWGEAWVIGLHAVLAWPLAALIPAHIGGAILAGRRHRENLIGAMLHGRKRAPDQEPPA